MQAGNSNFRRLLGTQLRWKINRWIKQMEIRRVSVHRVVVLWLQTSAFFYRLKYTDSGLMHYLTFFFIL